MSGGPKQLGPTGSTGVRTMARDKGNNHATRETLTGGRRANQHLVRDRLGRGGSRRGS